MTLAKWYLADESDPLVKYLLPKESMSFITSESLDIFLPSIEKYTLFNCSKSVNLLENANIGCIE